MRNDTEKIAKQVEKLLKKRGAKALQMAREEVLKEKIECKEVKDALRYFMTEYWNDLARPTLLSLACEAVGGDPHLTTSIAVPMMLISGAIDIHDDIIDQSKTKYGKPTVYGKFGKEIALLIGDALLLKGLTLFSKTSRTIENEKLAVVSNTLQTMFFELGDAEAMEFEFRKRFDVSLEEYLKVIRKKAADVEAHTHVSAILGNGTEKEIDILRNYGRILGMLIVISDDIFDVLNTEELLHRIRKEHLPLPIIYVLNDPKTKPQLIAILKRERLMKNDAEKILQLVYDTGAFNQVEKIVENLIRQGVKKLENLKYCQAELALLMESAYPWRNIRKYISP